MTTGGDSLSSQGPPLASSRVHLVGGCGTGMRNLATILRQRGCLVTGSDASLQAAQHGFHLGHSSAHVPQDAQWVVYSEAVGPEHLECRRGEQLGAQVISYGAMLGIITAELRTLAIAGTHGKSSTTAMTAGILRHAGTEPLVACGADSIDETPLSAAGQQPVAVVEACEYRGNSHYLRPQLAAILNIELDHVDCYPFLGRMKQYYRRFAKSLPEEGLLLVSGECPLARSMGEATPARVETFGLPRANTWSAAHLKSRHGCYEFQLVHRQQSLGLVRLQVAGEHNVANALAAAALAWHAEVPAPQIVAGLTGFRGIRRRLEEKRAISGVRWIDDFAHHPTAVRAALTAVRQKFPRGRLWCVFEPHQVSRTSRFFQEFSSELTRADRVLVSNTYPAREPQTPQVGVLSANLAKAIRTGGTPAIHLPTATRLCEYLAQAIGQRELTPGDILVTMGAGEVGQIGHSLTAIVDPQRIPA